MATLTLTMPSGPGGPTSPGGSLNPVHPKAKIRTQKGVTLVLPFAPRGTTLGGWAAPVSVTPRPGRKDLTLVDGPGLESVNLTFPLARLDHQTSVEDYIRTLRRIARSRQRITLVNLSPSERGPWRITDVGVTGDLRQRGTNHLTRATVTLALLEASDPNLKVGPVSGGHDDNDGPRKHPKTYVIKRGDTLRRIANEFYGAPRYWRAIAKANGIKTPNNLKVGRRIKLPKVSNSQDDE